MWSTGSPMDPYQWIDRLREIGCTAEECTGCNSTPYVAKNFGFYVENLVPELAFLFNRQALYDADWQSYTSTHDTRYLWRKPSLNDPAFWSDVKPRLQGVIKAYATQRPLAYQLRDELSIGRYANPMDYDFDPNALRDFRAWLQHSYGTLDNLNQEWETSFSSWDAVTPMTTYEIKDREKAALAAGRPENYAPWADHREFMDITFNTALSRLRGYIRQVDPEHPVGIEGLQMPSAWGGYDLWRMSQSVDWFEPYDITGSREIFRSFVPPGTPILSTVFGTDYSRIRRKLWRLLLHGDRGAIIWDDDTSRAILKNQAGQPVTDRGRALGEIFGELKQVAPVLMDLRRLDDRIAIHYSQASIRAHWMFDSREDGNTWPRRFSSYEATHSRIAKVRESFLRVVEDLGLQYNFVSYEQIEQDELLRAGYKVLLLPQSVAMSDKECRAIETFVRLGGVVIADNMTATMDEHCKRRSRGELDALFGIQRSSLGWSAKPSGGTLPISDPGVAAVQVFEPDITLAGGTARLLSDTKVPAIIEHSVGLGRAIYLNLDMHDYAQLRLAPPQGGAYLNLFDELFREAGIVAPVSVLDASDNSRVPAVEVWRYLGRDALYFAIMRNPDFDSETPALESPVQVRVVFDRTGDFVDLRTGETFHGDRIERMLDPWSPIILKQPKKLK